MLDLLPYVQNNLTESGLTGTVVAWHGTRAKLPFPYFESHMEGTGSVSGGRMKYGGFFFTSERENAEFYADFLIARVSIEGVSSENAGKHPPTVMAKAKEDHAVYVVRNVIDGAVPSDVFVVPTSRASSVSITGWELSSAYSEGQYFDALDELFGAEEDEDGNEQPVTKGTVEHLVRSMEMDMKYLLSFPPFKKYYDSKDR